jgi:hypothetical protein
MLRESVELTGGSIDFEGLTDPSCTEIRGIPNSRELLQFTNACMGVEGAEPETARQALVDSMGAAAMIDTAGVISNFQRMVRIADAIGIPSDGPMQVMSEDLREQLGINQYVSAANSNPPPFFKRWMLKLIGVRMFRKMIREASTP